MAALAEAKGCTIAKLTNGKGLVIIRLTNIATGEILDMCPSGVVAYLQGL